MLAYGAPHTVGAGVACPDEDKHGESHKRSHLVEESQRAEREGDVDLPEETERQRRHRVVFASVERHNKAYRGVEGESGDCHRESCNRCCHKSGYPSGDVDDGVGGFRMVFLRLHYL